MKRKFYFISRLTNRIYVCLTTLFFIISISNFEINHALIKTILYIGFFIFTPLLFVWNIFYYKPKLKKFYRIAYPLLGFIYLFYANPLEIFNATNVWKTETILFENKIDFTIKIEYQTQKLMTSNGKKNRTVAVTYYTKYLLKIKKYNAVLFDEKQWNKK